MYQRVGNVLKYMTDVKSLSKFKQRKKNNLHKQNIQMILKVFDLTKRSLKYFETYSAAQQVILVIDNERRILESHLKQIKDSENE